MEHAQELADACTILSYIRHIWQENPMSEEELQAVLDFTRTTRHWRREMMKTIMG